MPLAREPSQTFTKFRVSFVDLLSVQRWSRRSASSSISRLNRKAVERTVFDSSTNLRHHSLSAFFHFLASCHPPTKSLRYLEDRKRNNLVLSTPADPVAVGCVDDRQEEYEEAAAEGQKESGSRRLQQRVIVRVLLQGRVRVPRRERKKLQINREG